MTEEAKLYFRDVLDHVVRLNDAIDTLNPRGGVWTYWDYQAGAWQRDHGFRIDHLLLSPELADRMTAAGVDKAYRGREKASDHTPVWVEIGDAAPAGGRRRAAGPTGLKAGASRPHRRRG